MGLSNDPSCEAGSLSCCRPVLSSLSVHECGATGYYPRSACPLSHSESDPLGLSVRKCGATGSASGQTACPFRPTLHQSWSCHSNVSPLLPGAHLRPSYQSGCMFLFYLLGVGLPCRWIFFQFFLCKESQCVYLRHHLGSPIITFCLTPCYGELIPFKQDENI